ncbi:MAG TPA: alkene reductase [Stellaceae bacterium]|nr:alkene reductase [Stellaceae bacterium]
MDIFTPIKIGSIELANRIVMAPLTRNRAGAGNVPTPLAATYYAQRASAGLIVTEATQISPQGVGYPGTPGIHTDAQVEGWRHVTDAVHQAGGKIALQLWHVGRISHPTLQPDGALPVAPSAIAAKGQAFTASGMQPFPTPRALETDEIPDIVADYAAAARRAIQAGFDGVEIHGANGYLLDQFLRDSTNKRTDRYGGGIENRARFLIEVVTAVTKTIGANKVGIRISPLNPFNDISDSDPKKLFSHVVSALNAFGLAYLHVIEPVSADHPMSGGEVKLAPVLRQIFRGPFMLNGGYDRAHANAAIAEGTADLIAFGVPFLANPDLPARLRLEAPLNKPDQATFYGGDEHGYTDYPTLSQATA